MTLMEIALSGSPGTCHARLSGLDERVCRDGRPYKRVLLDDCEVRFKGFMWDGVAQTHSLLSISRPVAVTLKPRILYDEPVLDVLHIRSLELHEVNNGARLLPYVLCPPAAHEALQGLVDFNGRLKHPQLREFVTRVLLDPRIGSPLLSCKASMNHHHAERGGLLIHLMSGLQPVALMARSSGLGDEETELTEVSYLLHDLGKLSTVGSGDRRPDLGRLLRHEGMTPVLLAAHLDWLGSTWPNGATVLRYILDFIARPHGKRGFAKFAGAEIVTMADQLNVAGVRGRGMHEALKLATNSGPST